MKPPSFRLLLNSHHILIPPCIRIRPTRFTPTLTPTFPSNRSEAQEETILFFSHHHYYHTQGPLLSPALEPYFGLFSYCHSSYYSIITPLPPPRYSTRHSTRYSTHTACRSRQRQPLHSTSSSSSFPNLESIKHHRPATHIHSLPQPPSQLSPTPPSGPSDLFPRCHYIPTNNTTATHLPLESSISSALYLTPLVAIAVAFIIYEAVVPGQQEVNPTDSKTAALDQALYAEFRDELEDDMEPLPGRPGNLTPEQDEKLRKFWEVFLQVCGVLGSDDSAEASESAENQGKTEPGSSDKGKKKRHISQVFKRKDKKDKEGGGSSSDKTPTSAATAAAVFGDASKSDDSGDKWGENKTTQEVLAKHTPEEIRSTIWSMVKHDHPDALLLRFLRARKWDVQRALLMLLSTMNWRASEAHVDDDIMYNGEALAAEQEKSADEATRRKGADFLAQMRNGISFIHGVDKAGRLICVCKAARHRAGELSEESLERYTVYLIESSRLMLKQPADTACIIFDMTGFSLANMDYAPVKFMIKCFEANYPESLGVVLVHKAPWVFQGIWKVIRGWLDPVVAGKVNFTNSARDLEAFIARPRILRELEGEEDWTYRYVEPREGENAPMQDATTREQLLADRERLYDEYERRTADWIAEPDAARRAAIIKDRDDLARQLHDQYWRLDPYIRARSFYDRVGVIKPGGRVDPYPNEAEAKAEAPPPAVNGTAAPATTAPPVDTSADDLD